MTEHERLVKNIQRRMAFYVSNLEISTDRDYFDDHKEAEYFFRKPLSLLFDADVTNVNDEHRNFPGIDLADRKKRISFQITSTNKKQKVQHTLDEFLGNNLDKDFDRVIVLIVGTKTPPRCAKLTFKRSFDFEVKRDVWNIPRLIQEFEALPVDDRHKLQDFSDYLDSEMPNYVTTQKTLELPLPNTLEPSKFVGREKELEDIRSRFEKGDKKVILTGLGGIGKTELAIQYGREHEKQQKELHKDEEGYECKVYFVRFDGSLTRTLASMAQHATPAFSSDELRQPETVLSGKVYDILMKADANDLLIIDNINNDDKDTGTLKSLPGYQDLMRLPLKILMTTRPKSDDGILVEKIEDDHLRKVLTRYGAQMTKDEMDTIIQTIKGHTLTIDLIARTLGGYSLLQPTAQDMILALETGNMPPELFRDVETDYNGSLDQMQIYLHLCQVFNVSKVSDEDRNLLCVATLFPEDGIAGKLLVSILPKETLPQWQSMINRGWLNSDNRMISIHPVIRSVCRLKLKPTDENCGDFLNSLWKQFDDTVYDHSKYTQIADVFAQAADSLEERQLQWLYYCLVLRGLLGQVDAVEDLIKQLDKINYKDPTDDLYLAGIYGTLSLIYQRLGDDNNEQKYRSLCIQILHKQQADGTLSLFYQKQGDDNNEQKYRSLCRQILHKQHTDDSDPNIRSNNVDLLILNDQITKNLSTESNDNDFILENISQIINDTKAAEKPLDKLYSLTERLTPNHPTYAHICTQIADLLLVEGQDYNPDLALEYYQTAIVIYEDRHGPEHQYTENARRKLETALTKLNRSSIDSNNLPVVHPDHGVPHPK